MSKPLNSPVVLFYEVQRPRWTFGTTVLAIMFAYCTAVFVVFNDGGFSAFRALYPVGFAFAVLASVSRLRTVVLADRLELISRWRGDRIIPRAQIRSAHVGTFYRRMDQGFGARDGQAVILKLDDGDIFHIGSARAEELCEVLRSKV